MEKLVTTTKKLLELMGFHDPSVDFQTEARKIVIYINEGEWIKERLPLLVAEFERVLNLIAKRDDIRGLVVDVNGYRRERENLIIELAKAAAKRAAVTKANIALPAMNGYERRLIHVELANRPDVVTESIGEKRERHVVIKPSGI